MHPECFLAEDVAHPDDAKHMTIVLGFSKNDDLDHHSKSFDKYLDKRWYEKYFYDTDTLCSDIANLMF